ncbi:MAG: hypothetical protein WC905_00115 [Patescibacteria group bacterium]|jgi:hypothetical protein
MFQIKKKKNKEAVAASPIVQDFVVHNMPTTRPQPMAASAPASGGIDLESVGFAPVAPKRNFKTVGLFIIIGGLIVVSAFVYLSYRFIIRPAAKVDSPVNTATSTIENEEKEPIDEPSGSSSAEVVSVSTSSELVTVTPEVIGAASTTNDGLLLGEESLGRDGSNLPPVADADSDGLSDDEEAVLGTLVGNADSDSDSYNDLAEIQKGYNPIGAGQLKTNNNLLEYQNSAFKYKTIVPKSWSQQSLNDGATVILSAPDESLLQISVQDNTDQTSILSWYSQSFPDNLVTYDKLESTDSYDGIMGEGGLNFYLTDKNRRQILVISYIPAVNNRLAYPNIFRLVIDSLVTE